ncbi:thiol-disulfide isomerase/thioredoxin [Mucilaginibacter gracilis]|uniref:Thiol-disulfide isomerase/thioredoxin n=1 Tax=Mucilaginibacter gracilis TaxID=423350 RepID=A0A495IYS9_9SPHI|nr:TlpA disulfide reductase family protein [Mucilaginibacter gracilis]RKR81855.1 thiol-disulfide isomerase/thioredoxin [Mucilaginibacter gracilis]
MKTMKKNLALAILFIFGLMPISSFGQQKIFKVRVQWQGGDGKQVLLSRTENGLEIKLDSVHIVNGTADLNIPATKLFSSVYLSLNHAYMQELLVYPGVTTVQVTNDAASSVGSTVKISGDLSQQLYQEKLHVFMTGLLANMARSHALRKIGKDSVKKDSIMAHYRVKFDSLQHAQDYITTKYPDEDIAGYILTLRAPFLSVAEREKEFNSLSARVKNGPYGVAVKDIVTSIENRKIGHPGFQFAENTKDNKPVKLADYKGKYVLIDFWSSTCGPCLRMAPKMKKLYDAYKDKGFEIIAVSLDKKREDWLRAAEQHQISGILVSSLKGGDDPIAKYYGVQQMPAMILIDRQGNNAGQVDPEKLDEKLAEIFDKI